jgi:hypothetical protein
VRYCCVPSVWNHTQRTLLTPWPGFSCFQQNY